MKISYKHLVERIKDKPNIQDLSNKLLQLGHEHEIDGDIFDIELTPNRGDCLSINGLLRDLNLFYCINDSVKLFQNNFNKFNFDFTNNAKKDCPKISFLKIQIEEIPESYNQEMESYFSELSLKKNNFFTDVSNYISYETGQPTHCYEASKISDGIRLEYLKSNQSFKTLHDKSIELKEGDLVFINKNNEVINLAGIIGGESTSCKKNTNYVIVECAYFNPEAITGKAIKFALQSEAAHKFERGVDPSCHEYVFRRFIQIIEEHTNITNIEMFSETYSKFKRNTVQFCDQSINKILGTKLSKEECEKYLKNLGFSINEMMINIPSFRHDISSENDIAEEIARALGYNNIEQKSLDFFSFDKKNVVSTSEINLKNLLIDNGFNEVINDPFTAIKEKTSIEIDNPLDINRRYMRTNLKNSLLDNLIYNEKRQQDSIKLFEISDVYKKSLSPKKRLIGIIISGRVDKNHQDFTKKLDTKYLSNILNVSDINSSDLKYEVISRTNIDTQSKNIITYLEIELGDSFVCNYLTDTPKQNKIDITYIPISSFPSSTRDLSYAVKEFSNCKPLQDYILNFSHELLKESYIFDYFYNKKNDEIKIGFRLVFQSKISTITEAQVNELIGIILEETKKFSGISIPGLK